MDTEPSEFKRLHQIGQKRAKIPRDGSPPGTRRLGAGMSVETFEYTMSKPAGGLKGLFGRLRTGRGCLDILLDDEAITAPARPGDKRPLRLTYKGISDISAKSIDGVRTLVVKHMDGNMFISSACLADRESFDRLWRALEAHVGRHRGYRY